MDWDCASCRTTVRTGHRPAGPMHDCPGMAGLSFRLVKAGERTRNRTNLREDYLSGDLPQRDGEGNYVMSVNTDYPDGRSALTIYPPTTIVSANGLDR